MLAVVDALNQGTSRNCEKAGNSRHRGLCDSQLAVIQVSESPAVVKALEQPWWRYCRTGVTASPPLRHMLAQDPGGLGSMLELSWNGTRELQLVGGAARTFLEDGDTVTLRGYCQGDGVRVGFGECSGLVLPAVNT